MTCPAPWPAADTVDHRNLSTWAMCRSYYNLSTTLVLQLPLLLLPRLVLLQQAASKRTQTSCTGQ